MKSIGLMFQPDMIQAFLEERKTQTRRTRGLDKINEHPDEWELVDSYDGLPEKGFHKFWVFKNKITKEELSFKSPFGGVGDEIYCKETWMCNKEYDHFKPSELPEIGRKVAIWYFTDGNHYADKVSEGAGRIRSAMFMPRWASRIHKPIVSVKPERLLSITPEDCIAEGIYETSDAFGQVGYTWDETAPIFTSPVKAYLALWDKINGKKKPASSNLWLWRIEMERKENK